MMRQWMRKLGLATTLFMLLALQGKVQACPSCAGSVPWNDCTDGEAEGQAYNRTIGLMLAAPAFLVCSLAMVSRGRKRRNPWLDE